MTTVDFASLFLNQYAESSESPSSSDVDKPIPFPSFPFSFGKTVDDSVLESRVTPLFSSKNRTVRRPKSAPPKLHTPHTQSARPLKRQRAYSPSALTDSAENPNDENGRKITIPSPQHTVPFPPSFEGTCLDLVERIGETVHRTVGRMDFDGLKPYLKLFDQMKQGISAPECVIDCNDEAGGSTCVGMSLQIIKKLEKTYKIKGVLAVERPNASYFFGHASVIIPCEDGYVFLDPRSNPDHRIFSVPYGSTSKYKDFVLTAGKKGASPALILKNQIAEQEESFEYFIDVANGADIVAKSYLFKSVDEMIPIAAYKPDGSPLKSIKIIPSESMILFKDHVAGKEKLTTFEWVDHPSFAQNLETFMGSDFHMSTETAYKEISSFVAQQSKLAKAFDLKKTEQDSPWS